MIGGGIIGLEMATVYDALGSRVTVVELLDQLVPGCDDDLVEPLRKRVATDSEGCAPLRSQASARSSSMSITDGSPSGLYFPMISMNLPSRGLRWSATTTR